MKDVELLEVAEKELDEAVEYYNQEQLGLVKNFFLSLLIQLSEFVNSLNLPKRLQRILAGL